ncbi:hypothetical protein [Streptomyces sp. BBFR2]|uniref:hypothetical protein n=1 Tax=Streptomyces sp. BBFR2 TaxID=3372854 RepID=UPI0037D9C2C0
MTAHGGGPARWNSDTQRWEDGAPPPAPYTGPPPRPAWTPPPAAPSAPPAGGGTESGAGASGAGAASAPDEAAPAAAPGSPPPSGAEPAAAPAPYPGQAALDALPGSMTWDERPTVAGRRSPRRTAALVAGAAVAVIGLGFGGGWLLWGSGAAPDPKPAPSPTAAANGGTSYPELPTEPTEPTPTGTGLPEGFHLVHNTDKDFTLAVPEGWQHSSRTDGEFYTSPDERGLVQVFEISDPDETPRHSLETASESLAGNPGYTEIERGAFGDGAPSSDAAKLVYAYDSAQLGERVQVVDCAFSTPDGRQFAVLVRGPVTDWPQQESTLRAALNAFVPHA